jgi:hypothetical protein
MTTVTRYAIFFYPNNGDNLPPVIAAETTGLAGSEVEELCREGIGEVCC